MQLLVIEGGKPDKSEKDIFNNYLKVNYAYKSGYEMQYDKIKPLIFVEEYIKNTNAYFHPLQQFSLDFQEHRQSLRSLFYPLRQNSSDFSDYRPELFEYLIFCFNGEPKLILFGSGKRTNKIRCTMFDTEWNNLHFNYGGYLHETQIPKPKNLDKMLKIAKILSKDFKFVRVDLHNINGKIYFGEMTFTPASGYMKFKPRNYVKLLSVFRTKITFETSLAFLPSDLLFIRLVPHPNPRRSGKKKFGGNSLLIPPYNLRTVFRTSKTTPLP